MMLRRLHHSGLTLYAVMLLEWTVTLLINLINLYSVLAQSRIIRLQNGSKTSQGRVEVYYYGRWGTVCDDYFDNKAATVVCRMLGYTGHAAIAHGNGFYGSGTGSIWLDDVHCQGNETSIFFCQSRPWGVSNCRHSKDVGVDCQPDDPSIVG